MDTRHIQKAEPACVTVGLSAIYFARHGILCSVCVSTWNGPFWMCCWSGAVAAGEGPAAPSRQNNNSNNSSCSSSIALPKSAVAPLNRLGLLLCPRALCLSEWDHFKCISQSHLSRFPEAFPPSAAAWENASEPHRKRQLVNALVSLRAVVPPPPSGSVKSFIDWVEECDSSNFRTCALKPSV